MALFTDTASPYRRYGPIHRLDEEKSKRPTAEPTVHSGDHIVKLEETITRLRDQVNKTRSENISLHEETEELRQQLIDTVTNAGGNYAGQLATKTLEKQIKLLEKRLDRARQLHSTSLTSKKSMEENLQNKEKALISYRGQLREAEQEISTMTREMDQLR
ncbi:hypothetical protein KIPB_010162 [Kipferlia bialata]|uniref:Uncharacterized protein n=1 Tax=Kipferlia bialata TaxID=797122 RepID=A0A9K3GMS1_9EUKA|nr:hypothetical protein KIPB_010162 [Kipferlia bialata]|eukprot:g10162.t1